MTIEHTPQSIQQLARGFTQSRLFITGAELDIYSLLADQAQTAEMAASHCQADLRGMTILLDALTAQGFLLKQNGHYQTDPSVAPFLSADSPDSILPMVLHSSGLWQRWSQLTDIVQGTATPEAENDEDNDMLPVLVKGMHVVNLPKAPVVIQKIQPGTACHLLDVGGGAGAYTLACLQAAPDRRATLFDFPAIVPIAREQLHASGMDERVKFVAGDYMKDKLPGGHDMALLSAVIHQHSPGENIRLYENVYQALLSGGRIVIRGFVMDEDKVLPTVGAMFSVNMLTSTQGGQTYSFNEVRDGLEQAGFTQVRLLCKSDDLFSLIDAVKP